MCGFYAYIGNGNAAEEILLGLTRLEYRGYDSWGIMVTDNGSLVAERRVGPISKIDQLTFSSTASVGIGHTRWATHGKVTVKNAHPIVSSSKKLAVVHNGIVENYQELKEKLISTGYQFITETDTEVITALLELNLTAWIEEQQEQPKEICSDSWLKIISNTFSSLKGRNSAVILDTHSNQLIGIRKGSPLVVGIGKGETFITSDLPSFSHKTETAAILEDNQMVVCNTNQVSYFDIKDQTEIAIQTEAIAPTATQLELNTHQHYMLKEILEQSDSITNAIEVNSTALKDLVGAIRAAKNVFTVAAGGAFFAAQQITYLLRTISGIQAYGLSAYEFESHQALMLKGDLVIAVSQSGETADTINALDIAAAKGLRIASVVNMPGATISRRSEFPFMNGSGLEQCVISTKTATAQMTFGYLLSMSLADRHNEAKSNVQKLSAALKGYLSETLIDSISLVADAIGKRNDIFVLGKGRNYHIAEIGAHNIKEASYYHAEGLPAGELKHGALALVEEGTPVISLIDCDNDYDYMLTATAEAKARGAMIIGLAVKENTLFDQFIPLPSILDNHASVVVNNIPCQLLAYQLAVANNIDPDRPRNLAKCVTVR